MRDLSSIQDLSCLTRDGTHAPCSGHRVLTTEPPEKSLKSYGICHTLAYFLSIFPSRFNHTVSNGKIVSFYG